MIDSDDIQISITPKGAEIMAAAARRYTSGEFPTYIGALRQVINEAEGEPRIEGVEPPERWFWDLVLMNGTSDLQKALNAVTDLIMGQVAFRVDYENGVWQFQIADSAVGVNVVNDMGDED